MKLPATEHTRHPWLIHTLAPDFELEDVWALPTPGGPDDLSRLVDAMHTLPFPEAAPLPVRVVWAARWKLGEWFRWDRPESGVGTRVPSLRDRLPDDLRNASPGGALEDTPFMPVYQLPDEYAAEMANATVHGILHLGWVADGSGGYRGQMAVLVKPRGRRGALYMAAIKPFRLLLVYPMLLRVIEKRWRELTPQA
jgi:uncharacterized protein DUF2867